MVMDYFSKWVEAYTMLNKEASIVADVLVKEVHSDQGWNFESELFQNLCRRTGIRKNVTTFCVPSLIE